MHKNIAIICFKYPPEYSGYGKQLKSVISEMSKLEHEFKLTLLTAHKSSKMEENEYLQVEVLGSNNTKSNGILFYTFCLKTLMWLIVNQRKYDIIHCIKAGPEAVVANMASKVLGKTLIVKVAQDELSDREIENASYSKRFIRIGRQILLKTVNYFIAISEEIEVDLSVKVSKKTKVMRIPNGVDDEKFKPITMQLKDSIRIKLDLPKDRVVILFAGAINKRKGIIDLLNAVSNLNSEKEYILVICGPILESVNFESRINEISKNVCNLDIIYRGVVNNIDEYMQASDIFVLPSYSEGLPNVLLEAASSGLGLVSTNIGGSRDIVIDGETGFLVPTNNSKLLGERIHRLIHDEELRSSMGIKARNLIEDKFSVIHVAHSYLKLYRKIIEN